MPQDPDDIQMARYGVVSKVLAHVASGMAFSRAIRQVAKEPQFGPDGRRLRISVRTLQRWVAAFQSGGPGALCPVSRQSEAPSKVLSEDFLQHLIATKTADADASIPEVIRQARISGLVRGDVSRVTVWRAARKLNLPIFSCKVPDGRDMRRFAFAHRMQMVLADGKHFRAGPKERKRVVITVLDDASRFALGAVVGTSESAGLFLSALWQVIRRWGRPECFYLDNGPGFIARDVISVCARLGIGVIHGTAGYAEGHGKIERYHRTLKADLLRSFPGNPEIDADLIALEHRIEHYHRSGYNPRSHEELPDNIAPETRFLNDTLPLRPLEDEQAARRHFLITRTRKVSRDNIIKLRRIPFEVPRGHAGRRIKVFDHLLDGDVAILHEGRLVRLHPVDLTGNARSHRARAERAAEPARRRPAKTAATMHFAKDHPPLVNETGDCFEET